MKRRDFFTTSAGLLVTMVIPGVYSIKNEKTAKSSYRFRKYREDNSFGNVNIVTPDNGFYIHTFFDVRPFSPSQKLLAVTKFPYQNRPIEYGDTAEVCVVDLQNETIQKVYTTKGWGYQLGANLNWGKTDRYLYTNDIINDEPVSVRIDLETMETNALAGPMYHISPDETAVIGFPLDIINETQMGYGVPNFRDYEINGAPSDQGLWHTSLSNNKKKLLVSLNDVYRNVSEKDFYDDGTFYFFHTKYNQQGTKIFQVTRVLFPEDIVSKNPSKKGRHPMLMIFDKDGTNIHEAVTRKEWDYGGNHPNWHPDGDHIVMNLTPKWLGEDTIRFCMVHHSGKDLKILSTKHDGTRGHNSVTPDTKYLLGDYYVREYKPLGYDECPIRLIDLNTQEEVHICKVFTDLDLAVNTFRVDPHPVWSQDYKKVCFNGAPNGRRQVFVADLDGLI